MATLHLQIVTPEAKIYDDQVEMVVLPGVEGELGILPLHTALMTQIKPGELQISRQGKKTFLAVGDGFAQITQDQVSVLTDLAVEADAIDEQKTQEAIQRAEEAIRTQSLVGEELEATQATLARSLAQLNLRKKRRG